MSKQELSPDELGRIYSEQLNIILTEERPNKVAPVLEHPGNERKEPLPLNMLITRSEAVYYRRIIERYKNWDIFAQTFLVAHLIAAFADQVIEESKHLDGIMTEQKLAEITRDTRQAQDHLVFETKLESDLQKITDKKSETLPKETPRTPSAEELKQWHNMELLAEWDDYQKAKQRKANALLHADKVKEFLSEEQQRELLIDVDDELNPDEQDDWGEDEENGEDG